VYDTFKNFTKVSGAAIQGLEGKAMYKRWKLTGKASQQS
jgi:hypothetical protein